MISAQRVPALTVALIACAAACARSDPPEPDQPRLQAAPSSTPTVTATVTAAPAVGDAATTNAAPAEAKDVPSPTVARSEPAARGPASQAAVARLARAPEPPAEPRVQAPTSPPAAKLASAPELRPAASAPASATPVAQAQPSKVAEPAAAQSTTETRSLRDIQSIMANNRPRVRACYDQARAKNPALKDKFTISFTIDPAGNVTRAQENTGQSEIHDPRFVACAVQVVRSLKFPPSSRGMESQVNYPFLFGP